MQRPFQDELAKQGIDASPEEAHKLFMQKIVHDAKNYLQQYLAERGIDVSPDEAVAIHGLHLIHRIMARTSHTNPRETT